MPNISSAFNSQPIFLSLYSDSDNKNNTLASQESIPKREAQREVQGKTDNSLRQFARRNAATLLEEQQKNITDSVGGLSLKAESMLSFLLRAAVITEQYDQYHRNASDDSWGAKEVLRSALFGNNKMSTVSEVLDSAVNYVQYKDMSAMYLDFSEATDSETNFMPKHTLSTIDNISPQGTSDRDIKDAIQKLIDEMQNMFMDPFMDATEKMTAYYSTLSKIREVIAANVEERDQGNNKPFKIGFKDANAIMKSLNAAIAMTVPLFPATGGVASKAEAQAWQEKMGVGVVEQGTDGKWRVVIDKKPLEDFTDMMRKTIFIFGGIIPKEISQTEYNNLMSAMDSFLTKESTKSSKITNQLEYYNKLINNVQETLMQFFKQMAEVANSFLRI